jgi:hypothetical protein
VETTGKCAQQEDAEFTQGGPDLGGGADGPQEEVGNSQLGYRAYLRNMGGQYSFRMEAATILACCAAGSLRWVYAFFWPGRHRAWVTRGLVPRARKTIEMWMSGRAACLALFTPLGTSRRAGVGRHQDNIPRRDLALETICPEGPLFSHRQTTVTPFETASGPICGASAAPCPRLGRYQRAPHMPY